MVSQLSLLPLPELIVWLLAYCVAALEIWLLSGLLWAALGISGGEGCRGGGQALDELFAKQSVLRNLGICCWLATLSLSRRLGDAK